MLPASLRLEANPRDLIPLSRVSLHMRSDTVSVRQFVMPPLEATRMSASNAIPWIIAFRTIREQSRCITWLQYDADFSQRYDEYPR